MSDEEEGRGDKVLEAWASPSKSSPSLGDERSPSSSSDNSDIERIDYDYVPQVDVRVSDSIKELENACPALQVVVDSLLDRVASPQP